MSYIYSLGNRLEAPHNYMYAQFQGAALLHSYQSSRMDAIRRYKGGRCGNAEPIDHLLATAALPVFERLFESMSFEAREKFRTLLQRTGRESFIQDKPADVSVNDLAKNLARMTITESVTTSDLLQAIVASQLINAQESNIKEWLDRLVQRFEVTKKLYESYPPGFRKGEGANTLVRLYWMFALALCLSYARTTGFKYLSTLLKVCDLLCSLPDEVLQDQIPGHGLIAVLAAELVSVQHLAENKGVLLAAK